MPGHTKTETFFFLLMRFNVDGNELTEHHASPSITGVDIYNRIYQVLDAKGFAE